MHGAFRHSLFTESKASRPSLNVKKSRLNGDARFEAFAIFKNPMAESNDNWNRNTHPHVQKYSKFESNSEKFEDKASGNATTWM